MSRRKSSWKTLTYWVAEIYGDSACYNVRAKTRKEALAKVAEYDEPGRPSRFGAPHKVTITYRDAFDLVEQCLGEGHIYEGQ